MRNQQRDFEMLFAAALAGATSNAGLGRDPGVIAEQARRVAEAGLVILSTRDAQAEALAMAELERQTAPETPKFPKGKKGIAPTGDA